jgi:hypothetical protein
MVSPGLLQNPEVKRWLAGVEPAWTLLEFDSLKTLRKEPSAENCALRLAANLMNQDLLGSSIARNAVVLLDGTVKANGLKLTATGNLARSVVEEMCQSFEWPGHDNASAFKLHKVVNEPDFMPLFFIRTTMQKAGLLQRRKGKLLPTKSGRELIAQGQQGPLQAILFHIACWRLDLSYFGKGASRFLAAVRYGRRPLVSLDGGIRLGNAGKIVAPVHDPYPGGSLKYRLGPRRHRVRGANLATAGLVRPP